MFALLLAPATPLIAQTDSASSRAIDTAQREDLVIVRYFHPTIRCSTCLNIERVARALIEDRYAGDSTVLFRAYDFQKPENADFVRRFELTGSALYICRGDSCANLTEQAFKHAFGNIGKLQTLLISEIDQMRGKR
jgi:hypothetical protein